MNNKTYFLRHIAKKSITAFRKERRRLGIEYDSSYTPIVCYADPYTSQTLLLDKLFEKKWLEFLSDTVFPRLPRRSVCLDIGAYIGNDSLSFAQHFDKVIAFEPHLTNYQLLNINVERYPNILTVNKGCSNRSGIVEVSGTPDTLAIDKPLHLPKQNEFQFGTSNFEIEPLDTFEILKKCDSVDFVKIDTEGHEKEVFEGAKRC